MELMKVLSDPRRSRILHLAQDKPVTVKYLAEQLGEDPLNLYYHVKKMMKLELLEVVDTKQHGNLTEKYYRAVNIEDVVYSGNLDEQSDSVELTMSLVHRRLDPGLKLFQKALEKVREDKQSGVEYKRLPYNVTINSSTDRMTGIEWRKTMEPIMQAMGKNRMDKEPLPELPPQESDEEEATYQYVLISYKIEDADKLGLISPTEDSEEE